MTEDQLHNQHTLMEAFVRGYNAALAWMAEELKKEKENGSSTPTSN